MLRCLASKARQCSEYIDASTASIGFVDTAKRLLVQSCPRSPSITCGLAISTPVLRGVNTVRVHTVVQMRHSQGCIVDPASIASLHTVLQQAKAHRGRMQAPERAASRLVLLADGPHFTAGSGVEAVAFSPALAEAMDIVMDDIETMLRFPVDDPTVAVVRGSAIGVGAEIALSCRELLLGDDAVLQLHEHAAGGRRIPASVLDSYVWLRKAGGGQPQSALLTRKFTAAELERCGRAAAVFRFGPAFSELDAVDTAVAENEAFDAAYAALAAASRRRRGEPPSEEDIAKAFAPVRKLLTTNPHRLPPSSNGSGIGGGGGSNGADGAEEDGEEWDSPAAALAQYSAASKHLGGDDAEAGNHTDANESAPASQPVTTGRGRSRRAPASRAGSSASAQAAASVTSVASSMPSVPEANAASAKRTPQTAAPGHARSAAAAKSMKKAHRPEDDDSLLSV